MVLKHTKRRAICMVLAISLVIAMFPQMASANDYGSHWAGATIEALVSKGIVKPDQYGNTNPNKFITRAEAVAIIVRAFGLTETDSMNAFSDVNQSDWFAKEIGIAHAAGLINGDGGKVRPNAPITREEYSTIAGRYLALPAGDAEVEYAKGEFSDASTIKAYALPYVGALSKENIITGYPDRTFKGYKNITRAEAFVVLQRMMEGTETLGDDATVGTGKTLGNDDSVSTVGSVNATGPNATIKNMIINGDLTIYNGGVKLEGVTVKGNVFIKSGGSDALTINSTNLVDSIIGKVQVQSEGAGVSVKSGTVTEMNFEAKGMLHVTEEPTSVAYAATQTVAKLSDSQPTMFALGNKGGKVSKVVVKTTGKVEITGSVDTVVSDIDSANIVLVSGTFGSVELKNKSVTLIVMGHTTIVLLTISAGASSAKVDLAKDATINKAVIEDKATFTGRGTIEAVVVNAAGVIFEVKPDSVAGTDKPTIGVVETSGGGGGGGSPSGGGGGGSTSVVVNSINVLSTPELQIVSGTAIRYAGLKVELVKSDSTRETVEYKDFTSKSLTVNPVEGTIASGSAMRALPVTITHTPTSKTATFSFSVYEAEKVLGVSMGNTVTMTEGKAGMGEIKSIEITSGAAAMGNITISYGATSMASININSLDPSVASAGAIAQNLANALATTLSADTNYEVMYKLEGIKHCIVVKVLDPEVAGRALSVDVGGTRAAASSVDNTPAVMGTMLVSKVNVITGATSAGMITVTANGVSHDVTVAQGDSASAVATKVAAAFASDADFTVTASGSDIMFTAKVAGAKTLTFAYAIKA